MCSRAKRVGLWYFPTCHVHLLPHIKFFAPLFPRKSHHQPINQSTTSTRYYSLHTSRANNQQYTHSSLSPPTTPPTTTCPPLPTNPPTPPIPPPITPAPPPTPESESPWSSEHTDTPQSEDGGYGGYEADGEENGAGSATAAGSRPTTGLWYGEDGMDRAG